MLSLVCISKLAKKANHFDRMLRIKTLGYQDDTASKDTYAQTWQSESDLWSLAKDERSK